MTDLPVRPAFWNVPLWGEIGVYILGIAAVVFLVLGVIRNRRLILRNKPAEALPAAPARLSDTLKAVFCQKKIRETGAGRRHAALCWGFYLLFCGTALATLDWDIGHYVFGSQFLRGPVYLVYKFVLDMAGIAVLVTLFLGARRRFAADSRLPADRTWAAAYLSLAFIVLTGFLVEALRLSVMQPAWSMYSPVGHALAQLLMPLSEAAREGLHTSVWTVHGLASLAFIAAVPATVYAHLYRVPVNIYVHERRPAGALPKIENIEEQETFGISDFSQFDAVTRASFDACTACGRCDDVCPAVRAGTPLSPRDLLTALKARLHAEETESDPAKLQPLSEVVPRDALWSCTTCGACARACPAGITLPQLIVQMRRHQALELGEFPEGAATALENTASVGNPWGLDPYERMDWAQGLDVPVAEPGQHVDVLYWVGCAASYDRRARKIARAMVKILKASGTSFAVMAEERCHAEFARRLGEEYLYQTAAAENIANFAQYSFDRILTACPHCFNTLKNEYTAFEDFNRPVISHTEWINEQIQAGRLPALTAGSRKTVYHDPCYLARLNGVTEAPRQVLGKTVSLCEPAECGERTLCCGAGGGQMWTERRGDAAQMNVIRLRDLRATGAECAAVACPHCLTMLESARSLDREAEDFRISDIAEIVAEALPDAGEAAQ